MKTTIAKIVGLGVLLQLGVVTPAVPAQAGIVQNACSRVSERASPPAVSNEISVIVIVVSCSSKPRS